MNNKELALKYLGEDITTYTGIKGKIVGYHNVGDNIIAIEVSSPEGSGWRLKGEQDTFLTNEKYFKGKYSYVGVENFILDNEELEQARVKERIKEESRSKEYYVGLVSDMILEGKIDVAIEILQELQKKWR